MHAKGERGQERVPAAAARRTRIREDLERRGVAKRFSGPVSKRLATIAGDFAPEEYAAVLDGVAAAYRVHCEETRSVQGSASEIHRLIGDFAVELKKLDEGLFLAWWYRFQKKLVIMGKEEERTTGAGTLSRLEHFSLVLDNVKGLEQLLLGDTIHLHNLSKLIMMQALYRTLELYHKVF